MAGDALSGRTCKPRPVFGSLSLVWVWDDDGFEWDAAAVLMLLVLVVVLDGLIMEVILFFGAFEVDGALLAAFGAISVLTTW